MALALTSNVPCKLIHDLLLPRQAEDRVIIRRAVTSSSIEELTGLKSELQKLQESKIRG